MAHRSRRIRGLSPLHTNPLPENSRKRSSSANSALLLGVNSFSPIRNQPLLIRNRRESVIVHSNPGTGPSTPRSGDWDHYTEQPSFWNSRFGWVDQPSQIKLVNTDSDSSLDFDPNLFGEIERLIKDKQPLQPTMSAEEKDKLVATLKGS